MNLEFETVDVFTTERFSGNQLAVFPNASMLSAPQMQAIAREMSYSETTFVVSSPGEAPVVRIFTATEELPFAGHPSLGTAAVLSSFAPSQITLQLPAGAVPVQIDQTEYGAFCELVAPHGRRTEATPSLLAELQTAIGVRTEDLHRTLPCEVWSSGPSFALFPVNDVAALARAKPYVGPPKTGWPLGIVVFAQVQKTRLRARVFIPGDVVPEDPATGSANALVALYLHSRGELAGGERLTTSQGLEMRRPSELVARIETSPDGVVRTFVGGGVVPVLRGHLRL